MKNKEIEKIVEPLIPKIAEVCELHGVPFNAVFYSGSTSFRERADGIAGRVVVVLGDSEPGWRSKDNYAGRKALKVDMQKLIRAAGGNFSVRLQASYSCMQFDDGVVARRNDSGDVIGCYAE